MESVLFGLNSALNSGITLGLANTVITLGGLIFNLDVDVNNFAP